MRRALRGLGIALLALLAVLLTRAYALNSQQLPVEAWSPILIDSQRAAQRLSGAIRHRTVSYQDRALLEAAEFERLYRYLEKEYPELHAALEVEAVSDWSRLYRWRGRDPALPPVLLAAHVDVVPAREEGWTHPPFAGVVENGVVWGRGALDDKGSLVAIFEAITALLAADFAPERSVYVALGHDEEQGGDAGALAIARLLEQRGVALDWVLDEGAAVVEGYLPGVEQGFALLGIAEKGSVSIGLELDAPGGHSSAPPRHTAVGELAEALVALENSPLPGSFDGVTGTFLDALAPELPLPLRVVLANRWLFAPALERFFSSMPPLDAMLRTTTAVTIFNGGVKNNVLPQHARAVVNFRIHPNDRIETVAEHVRRVVDNEAVRIEVGAATPPRNPSGVSPLEGAAYTTLAKSIRCVFPEAAVLPFLVVGGTDGRHYAGLTSRVYRFLPFRIHPEAIEMLHGTDERVGAGNLVHAARFYAELLRRAAGPAQPSSR
ncbi:MAG: M20 family peptidase [Deltaproteobacteria bacterium]|nr:M20 family peptidase [Deltaproteobacteria bacterium]MBW2362813.1 M20 family peptidase [Deltaproteobacteria bacterium]